MSFIKAVIGSAIGLLLIQLINTYMGSTVRNMTEVLSSRWLSYFIVTNSKMAWYFTIIMITFSWKYTNIHWLRKQIFKSKTPIRWSLNIHTYQIHSTYIQTYIRTYVCMHVHTYVRVYTHMHTRTHAHTYIHTCKHTYMIWFDLLNWLCNIILMVSTMRYAISEP